MVNPVLDSPTPVYLDSGFSAVGPGDSLVEVESASSLASMVSSRLSTCRKHVRNIDAIQTRLMMW